MVIGLATKLDLRYLPSHDTNTKIRFHGGKMILTNGAMT